MESSRETEIQNETLNESASASVPEGETGAAQSGCKPKSKKTAAGRSSCKPFEMKAKPFDDDKDDGDGVLITLPNKNKAWKKFDKHFFFQKKAEKKKPDLQRFLKLAKKAFNSGDYAMVTVYLKERLISLTASSPPNDLSFVKTHYLLGVSNSFATKFYEAKDSFESAAFILQMRIENLKNPAEREPCMELKSVFKTTDEEIKLLETFQPIIRKKIANSIASAEEAIQKTN